MEDKKINKEVFKQYARTYENFDRVMECLYDITLFCAGRRDYVMGGIIEDCLKDLEVNNGKSNETT